MFVPDQGGHQFEMGFFGLTQPVRSFKRIKRLFWNHEEPSFYQCVRFAKRHQPQGYNPRAPIADPANETLWHVRQKMRRYLPVDQCQNVELYISLGTALDYFHGVDGFLYLQGMIVTIDLTVKPSKPVDKVRADFLLRRLDLVNYRKIAHWAEPVAERMVKLVNRR